MHGIMFFWCGAFGQGMEPWLHQPPSTVPVYTMGYWVFLGIPWIGHHLYIKSVAGLALVSSLPTQCSRSMWLPTLSQQSDPHKSCSSQWLWCHNHFQQSHVQSSTVTMAYIWRDVRRCTELCNWITLIAISMAIHYDVTDTKSLTVSSNFRYKYSGPKL